MAVKRIVPNIAAEDVADARRFYADLLGMDVAMDLGWIVTFTGNADARPQISVATDGGSGTRVPDVSIEVDDFDDVRQRIMAAGLPIEYGPVAEPWGVTRLYVRDPSGRLINILTHD